MCANCSQTRVVEHRRPRAGRRSPRRRRCRNPVGSFIQAFTETTQKVPTTPGDGHRHQHQQVPSRRHPVPAVEVDARGRSPRRRTTGPRRRTAARGRRRSGPSAPARAGPSRSSARCRRPRRSRTAPPRPSPSARASSSATGSSRTMPAPVHHEDHRREGDPEAGEHDVPAEGQRHLLPRREQPRRLGCSIGELVGPAPCPGRGGSRLHPRRTPQAAPDFVKRFTIAAGPSPGPAERRADPRPDRLTLPPRRAAGGGRRESLAHATHQ